MSNDCLVLDKTGDPISVIAWSDAVRLYNKDKIEVVREDDSKILRSQSFTMAMPTVIRLKNEIKRRARVSIPCSRSAIVIRDHATCQYCGRKLNNNMDEMTFDHVLPRCKGGTTTWTNTVVACSRCNRFKGDKTIAEVSKEGMFLMRKPKQPEPSDPRFKFRLKLTNVKPCWAEYFYWNAELDK